MHIQILYIGLEYLTSIIFVPGKVSRGRVSLGDSNQAEGLSRTWGKLLQGNFGGKFWREKIKPLECEMKF